MNELATQAANDTNTTLDRTAIKKELDQLVLPVQECCSCCIQPFLQPYLYHADVILLPVYSQKCCPGYCADNFRKNVRKV